MSHSSGKLKGVVNIIRWIKESHHLTRIQLGNAFYERYYTNPKTWQLENWTLT